MIAVVPAVAGALVVAGVLGVVLGLRPGPVAGEGAEGPVPTTGPMRGGVFATISTTSSRAPALRLSVQRWVGRSRLGRLSRRSRQLLLAGAGLGVLAAILTGWVVAVVVVPAAVAGLPVLLSAPASSERIDRLEAMEEWTRSLSGILTAGVGLEQALISTLRSTPKAIRPEVTRLASRLRARWATEDALRQFADELDDATGDLIAGNLILGARRRGAGVASVLESLAESVAADVRARREIESDRATPRSTARWVTVITIGVLVVLALTGTYITPYGSPLGQVLLVFLLALYVATLLWMRTMAAGKPLPRFIGAAAREAARP